MTEELRNEAQRRLSLLYLDALSKELFVVQTSMYEHLPPPRNTRHHCRISRPSAALCQAWKEENRNHPFRQHRLYSRQVQVCWRWSVRISSALMPTAKYDTPHHKGCKTALALSRSCRDRRTLAQRPPLYAV